jgi:hypothetical protein
MRTGEGHRFRFRATAVYSTNDPSLAEINGVIGAIEAEGDLLAGTLKGEVYAWQR